jgi:hypothetical protein
VEQPILQFVLAELGARKGSWRDIARTLEPDDMESYYSWLSKVARGSIPDPSVNKIQRLADYFRGINRPERAAA